MKTLGEDEVALIRHQYLKYDEMRRTPADVSEVNAEAHKVAQHVPSLVAHIYALEAELAEALSDDEPVLAFKPTAVRTFRLTEVTDEEDAD